MDQFPGMRCCGADCSTLLPRLWQQSLLLHTAMMDISRADMTGMPAGTRPTSASGDIWCLVAAVLHLVDERLHPPQGSIQHQRQQPCLSFAVDNLQP